MKILIAANGDSGGGSWFLADAINKYTKHEARSIRMRQTYLCYPYDIISPTDAELKHWFDWADVVHLRDRIGWKNQEKVDVVTFTGRAYRSNPDFLLERCSEANVYPTVSTVDMVTLSSKHKPEWLPNPREEMIPDKRHKKFTVCQAPTYRDRKGTETVIASTRSLGIDLELIERKSYMDCLRLKSRCHLLIDQFAAGYGNNAMEAWALDNYHL